jgi:hypothetical protein
MAEALGLATSILAVLRLSGTVVQYLHQLTSVSEDRQRILTEVTSISGLLYCLKDLAERGQWTNTWTMTISSLNVPDGPLEQLRNALERLVEKLAPATGLKRVGKILIWPLQKEDVKDILNTIERQKTLFGLALQNDHM